MVAVRDIQPLEMILWEEPAVVGPYSKSTIGCLQCFKKLNTHSPNLYTCSKCNFPMCDKECEEGSLHSVRSCLALVLYISEVLFSVRCI